MTLATCSEGVILATAWIVLNWILDFVALVPFSGQSIPRYFAEIGLEYLGMFATPVAIGYVLRTRARAAISEAERKAA